MKIAIAIFLTIACLYSIIEILGMVKSLRILVLMNWKPLNLWIRLWILNQKIFYALVLY